MLPHFVVIGAMKAGTTSLWHYLRAHPRVYMPRIKELRYFQKGGTLGRGAEDVGSRGEADGGGAGRQEVAGRSALAPVSRSSPTGRGRSG